MSPPKDVLAPPEWPPPPLSSSVAGQQRGHPVMDHSDSSQFAPQSGYETMSFQDSAWRVPSQAHQTIPMPEVYAGFAAAPSPMQAMPQQEHANPNQAFAYGHPHFAIQPSFIAVPDSHAVSAQQPNPPRGALYSSSPPPVPPLLPPPPVPASAPAPVSYRPAEVRYADLQRPPIPSPAAPTAVPTDSTGYAHPQYSELPPTTADHDPKGKGRESDTSPAFQHSLVYPYDPRDSPRINFDKMAQSYRTLISTVSPQSLPDQLSDIQSLEVLDRALVNAVSGLQELHPEAAERVSREWHQERAQRLSQTPHIEDVERAIVSLEQARDKEPAEGQPKKKKREKIEQECKICHATSTPEWRRGPLGPRTLCNACGLVWAKMVRVKKRQTESSTLAVSTNAESRTGHSGPSSRNSRAAPYGTGAVSEDAQTELPP